MKVVLLASLLAVVLPIYWQQESPKPNPNDSNAQFASTPHPQEPSPNASAVVDQKANNRPVNGAGDKTISYLSRLFSPENLPNIGLCIAGLGGIFVAVYTLKKIERQTVAMERNTGVLMQAERGRIVIYWDQLVHIDLSPSGVHDGKLSHCFNWSCANRGRTPVELTSVLCRFVVVEKLSELPEKPEYGAANERIYDGEPLQPDARERQTVWFCSPLETSLSFDQMQEKHRSGQCFLYAYGYARYRDIWENPHVTRFGVVRVVTHSIMEDDWLPAGPPAYNRCE
jgi:hypothetical protein